MRVTDISIQARNPNRVNVSVDGKYRFSLDIAQVVDTGLKKGQEIDEQRLSELESESEYGKLYARTLEYCLMRPHSAREVRDYLYRRTRATKYKSRRTGEIKEREGVSQALTDRVFERLEQKGYIDDEKFARYWVDNRNQAKGTSLRKLQNELRAKGVASAVIDNTVAQSERDDSSELAKMLAKKRRKYPDDQKLMQYLVRQGFRYDDVKAAVASDNEQV
jgi:regulatory protein